MRNVGKGTWSAVILLVFTLVSTIGCAPRVRVTANPTPCDDGFRFYRPKPYLLITPAGTTTKVASLDKDGKPVEKTTIEAGSSDTYVQIQLEYLPDFAEEYAVSTRPGLGTANVKLELKDGWNLTSVNQELDSQFDESIAAVSQLVSSFGKIAGGTTAADLGPNAGGGETVSEQKYVVSATNVPLGYYEAVIDRRPDGKKALYGWRYVGFMPFASCPTSVSGQDYSNCETNCLYGLVFEQGIMTFKQIGMIDLEKNLCEYPTRIGTVGTTQQ